MNTKLVNSAAGVINAALTQNRTAAGVALALDSAQMLMTPETARELEGLRARVAELETQREADHKAWQHDLSTARSGREATAIRIAELEVVPATVFRASHDSIVMGLYTTRQAAYEHCEAYERRDDAVSPMAWNVDEEGVAELVRIRVPRSPGAESATGYTVTPVEVASEYDEEADE